MEVTRLISWTGSKRTPSVPLDVAVDVWRPSRKSQCDRKLTVEKGRNIHAIRSLMIGSDINSFHWTGPDIIVNPSDITVIRSEMIEDSIV